MNDKIVKIYEKTNKYIYIRNNWKNLNFQKEGFPTQEKKIKRRPP